MKKKEMIKRINMFGPDEFKANEKMSIKELKTMIKICNECFC